MGLTPLMIALEYHQDKEIIEILKNKTQGNHTNGNNDGRKKR